MFPVAFISSSCDISTSGVLRTRVLLDILIYSADVYIFILSFGVGGLRMRMWLKTLSSLPKTDVLDFLTFLDVL